MNDTIKFWLDYFGGIDLIYVMLACLAFTQLFKMLLKAFGFTNPDSIRPFPYVVGAFTGLALIDFSSRGAMVGMVCGMISSIGFYGAVAYLEREAAPSWQKAIAKRVQLKLPF